MNNVYVYIIVFVVVWEDVTSTENCASVEIHGHFSDNRILLVKEGSDVHVTFYVNIMTCPDTTGSWLLKMMSVEDGKAAEECRIVIANKTCQDRELPQTCYCLHPEQLFVQFDRSFHQVDYKIFSWTSSQYTGQLGEVIFLIRKSGMMNDCHVNETNQTDQGEIICLSLPVIAGTSGVVVIIIIIAAVVLVCLVRERCKLRNVVDTDQDVYTTERFEASGVSHLKRWRKP